MWVGLQLADRNGDRLIFRLAICVLVLFAVTVWYCKCRGQDQRRREEVLAREMIIQRLNTATAPPSNYHSDAPPAYDDVINKPEDYPVYQAQGEGGLPTKLGINTLSTILTGLVS